MYDSSFEHSTISLSTLSHFYTSSFSRGILHFAFSLSPLCHIFIPLLFLGLFVILGEYHSLRIFLSFFLSFFLSWTARSFCMHPTKTIFRFFSSSTGQDMLFEHFSFFVWRFHFYIYFQYLSHRVWFVFSTLSRLYV
jgi:hypothetical protein